MSGRRRQHAPQPGQVTDRGLLVLAMAVFGTIPLLIRALPLFSAEIALYRAALAAMALMVYLALKAERPDGKAIRKAAPRLLLSGMIMGFNWVTLFEAYRYTTVSIATLSYYVAPVMMMAASALFFREKVTRWQLFCFAMTVMGLVLLIWTPGGASGSHLAGMGLGLLAALMYTTVVMMNKSIGGIGAVHRTLIQFLAAAAVLVPYVALTSGFHLQALTLGGWAALITLGVVHTGVTYCAYFHAVRQLPGREVALFSYIDPLVAVLLSALFLKEPFSLAQLAGGVMILGFTYLSGRKIGRVKDH